MAEKSGFFNARETEAGTYDREYDAEQFAEYFANFISNGVYVNPTNQLKVVFNNSPDKPFVVVVRKGKAYIDGYWYELTEDMEVTIPTNTKAYAIKDVVCCTLDKTERKISIILKEDVTSDMPTNNSVQHDLVLSTVLVQPNSSKLNVDDITDKRPDKTYCGFVTGLIDQIDTTELFKQYDDAFKEWFNEMKDQLTEDAAGNLQLQITSISNEIKGIKSEQDEHSDEIAEIERNISELSDKIGVMQYESDKHILIGKWGKSWTLTETASNIKSGKTVVDNDYYKTTTANNATVTIKQDGLYYVYLYANGSAGSSASATIIADVVANKTLIDDNYALYTQAYTYNSMTVAVNDGRIIYLPKGTVLTPRIRKGANSGVATTSGSSYMELVKL